MKKLTTKDFLNRLKKIHPNFLLVSEYKNTSTKIQIKDELDIVYNTIPNSLLCGQIPSLQTAVNKNTAFAIKSKQVHGNYYDYSKVNYTLSQKKVCIICPKHGEFLQTPADHLSGYRCRECGYDRNRISYNLFLKRVSKLHNSKYTYPNLNYKLITEKIDIICPEHGLFSQTVDSHMQGHGCPECKKDYNCGHSRTSWITFCNTHPERVPLVYILKCYNKDENFIKIGITSTSVHRRFLGNLLPYSYEILKEYKGSADFVFDKEKELHKLCKKYSYKPYKSFGGETECFTTNCLSLLPL